jgi:hypothetical protein
MLAEVGSSSPRVLVGPWCRAQPVCALVRRNAAGRGGKGRPQRRRTLAQYTGSVHWARPAGISAPDVSITERSRFVTRPIVRSRRPCFIVSNLAHQCNCGPLMLAQLMHPRLCMAMITCYWAAGYGSECPSGSTTLIDSGKSNLPSFSQKGSRSGAICVHRRSSAVEIFLLPSRSPGNIRTADERRWVRAVRIVPPDNRTPRHK